jgi:hypothetical protein
MACPVLAILNMELEQFEEAFLSTIYRSFRNDVFWDDSNIKR